MQANKNQRDQSLPRLRLLRPSRRLGAAMLILAALVPGAAYSASLEVGEGVVVKFGSDTALIARAPLLTADDVVFTSLADDSVGGQTRAGPGTPQPGDWEGLRIDRSVQPTDLGIDRLTIRYAGGRDRAALELSQRDYQLDYLQINRSITAIRVTDGAQPVFDGISLTDNGIALETDRSASTTIHDSDFSSNNPFAVFNRSSLTVIARQNWWGHETGPAPIGQGSPVSERVDYGQHLTSRPLIDCRIEPADGRYEVAVIDVVLRLHCRNAAAVRFAETGNFDPGAPYHLLGGELMTHQIDPQEGPRYIYAEFTDSTQTPATTIVVRTPEQITYTPDAPLVSIDSPPDGAVVTGDHMYIQVSASDASGIQHVTFSIVGSGPFAQATQAPYEAIWALGTRPDGTYTIRATATSGNSMQRYAEIQVHVQRQPPDVEGPTISNVRLNGVLLQHNDTITSGGLLTFSVQDSSGVASAAVTWDDNPIAGGLSSGTYSAPLLSGLTNGSYELSITAIDTKSNASELNLQLTVALPESTPPPVINAPATGTTVNRPDLIVAGTAQPGSTVQLYIGEPPGSPIGSALTASAVGAFSTTVQLPGEGSHALRATATAQTTSDSSAPTVVTFTAGSPSIAISTPPNGAVLGDVPDAPEQVDIAVTATDILGINQVQLYAGPQSTEPLGAPITGLPPYQATWNFSALPDGDYLIRAVATNTYGKTSETTHAVTVQRPQPPPPVVTPYVGVVESVTPPISYGGPTPEHYVTIAGRALGTPAGPTSEPVPNALLALMLKVNNFERRINVTTNDAGEFSFVFKPQQSDAGNYDVGVRHPDQATTTYTHQFTIDRISVQHPIISLHTAYCIPNLTCDTPQPIPVRITASAGNGASGLTIVQAADQPGGSWPSGIEVAETAVPALSGGQSVTVDVPFLAHPEANDQGAIRLAVVSGASVRAHILIYYTIGAPEPALFGTPNSIRTGVVRGQQVIETFTLGNRGAAPATNVQVSLRDENGNLGVPAWLKLNSSGSLGTLGIGESRTLQITAAPGSMVDDATYRFRVRVSSANAPTRDYLSSIGVSQSGVGAVKFHVTDIYTDPEGVLPDPEGGPGQPVYGLQGARIRIDHETLGNNHVGNTDSHGELLLSNLIPGRYNYRITAANHEDVTGRIHVRPGTNIVETAPGVIDDTFVPLEEVFLPYALVSFEWSVTETYIPDRYDVTITAIYQTQVPAPVVLIQPASVNLPDMQTGEEFSGTLTITNYGLIRAENVVFTPAADDAYFDYEFLDQVPSQLDAGQRITMRYKVTALSPLPGLDEVNGEFQFKLAELLAAPIAKAGSSCGSYAAGPRLNYGFQCINGDQQSGGASSRFSKMYGSSCGTTSPHPVGGGNGGGWCCGGIGGPLGGIPMGPPCTPRCNSCICELGGSGPGGPPPSDM